MSHSPAVLTPHNIAASSSPHARVTSLWRARFMVLLRATVTVLVPVAFLVGCERDAESVVTASNSNFKVELLFEYDGVKVYRFKDSGRSIYYTDARGGTRWVVQEGKNHSRTHTVPTVGGELEASH